MVDKNPKTSTNAEKVIDTLGKRCPMPILILRDSLDGVEVGKVVELIGDDIGMKMDIPAFCKRTAHQLMKTWEDKGTFHFLVKKGK
nr:sulfurtransferase TusA family protein [Candidatus Njordarchaeum guaymaensis]